MAKQGETNYQPERNVPAKMSQFLFVSRGCVCGLVSRSCPAQSSSSTKLMLCIETRFQFRQSLCMDSDIV